MAASSRNVFGLGGSSSRIFATSAKASSRRPRQPKYHASPTRTSTELGFRLRAYLYSSSAVRQFQSHCQSKNARVPCASETSIPAVFAALDTARADFGVVPVENSTEGSVTLTLDLLIDTPLVIIGEVLLPIRHALMSREGDAAAVSIIYSHQQSLGQCRNYLAANFPHCKLEAVASNTAAAQRAAAEPDAAAIASEAAAAPYGLRVIARNIQDSAQNT